MYECMYVCMHVSMYVCVHVCMYVPIYVLMYVCMCMYVNFLAILLQPASYPVCGMLHIIIKEPLLLIGKSSLCGGSGFPFSLSEWSLTI